VKPLFGVSRPVQRRVLQQLGFFVSRSKHDVTYVTEPKSWAIAAEGAGIGEELKLSKSSIDFKVSSRPYLHKSSVYHFGSQFMYENWLELLSPLSKVAVSFFHGKYGDEPAIDKNIDFLLGSLDRIHRVIVSHSQMRMRLSNLGVTPETITQIPIGVDIHEFSFDRALNLKQEVRMRLGIPKNSFVIGSFQKDGIGWGEGNEPKLIKGPDILVQVVKELSQNFPLFVLLSGPSRGYVINELRALNIPYKHIFFPSHSDVVNLFHALDVYLVTSREEGGPKGLLEALATGCPVVTTPVGMAPDLDSGHELFRVTKSIDASLLATQTAELFHKQKVIELRKELPQIVRHCSWSNVARLHLEKVYQPLLASKQSR
jgi:glycosyltransferase involved in cell wall biosynthesis